jgi:hypothetical protein
MRNPLPFPVLPVMMTCDLLLVLLHHHGCDYFLIDHDLYLSLP